MSILLRRLASLIHRRRAERELAEEMQLHREMAERDLRRSGVPDNEMVRALSRAMGNTTLAREDVRALWGFPRLESLWRDVRHGVRSLGRSPGLVVVSALSLGLGIGINTILYAGANVVYGHHPTMADPDRMVGVEPGNANQFSFPDYEDLLRSGIFADALGFRTASMNLGAEERVVPVGVLAVTANFFDVLRVRARLGRTFTAADAAAEREPRVVVLTQAFWRDRMGSDPSVIGRSLTLNNQPFVIAGVLPADYRAVTGWIGPGLYVPLNKLILPTIDERGSPSLSVLARLIPGSNAVQAQAAVTALVRSLEGAYPERAQSSDRQASVFPAEAMQFRGTPGQFFVVGGLLSASVGLVLVIACVNVAGLLVARAASRRSEIGIRMALGAGRGRLVQAMLVESFLLVLAGAAVALPLAFALGRVQWGGLMQPLRGALAVDGGLMLFSLAVITVTTALTGVIPALMATRADILTEVRQGGGGATGRLRLRHALVIGQIAMSLTLGVLTLLCVRSQLSLSRVDLGFDIDHGVVARFNLDASQYPGDGRVLFADRIVERLEQLPGVSSVSAANLVPLGGDSLLRSFHPAGRTDIPGTRPSTYSVGPRYFQSLAIPILQGRDFDASHVVRTPPVAIVNETFARTHFPGQGVVGQRVQTSGEPDAEIIGLVRDSKIDTLGEAPQSVVYYPFAQRPGRLIVHIRTSVPPEGMVIPIERVIDSVDGTVPISVLTLRGAASLELTMRRNGTVLMGSIAILGLVLTTVGLYGVMAYVVASRTVEIAIRMALGASAGGVRREILSRVLLLVAAGVGMGGVASLGLTPALRTFLVGISPFDPIAFGGAALLLVIVGLAAGIVPAVQASRVAPLGALKQQ